MTDATGRPAPQEFEKVLTGAAATVASFDEERLSLLQRLQRFLHVLPDDRAIRRAGARPAARRRRQSDAVYRREQFLDRADAGDGHRHSRRRTDAGHPDRWHRPFGRRHHGDFLGGHGASRRARRRSDHHRFSARPSCRRGLRFPQRDAGHAPQNAAVHRDARHAQHHRGAQYLLLAQRNHRHAGHR